MWKENIDWEVEGIEKSTEKKSKKSEIEETLPIEPLIGRPILSVVNILLFTG